MKHRTFGRSGIEVSEVVFGAGAVGGILIHKDDTTKREAIRRALDGGINWIDTAAQYGNGKSEEALGWLLPESGALPYLSTKFGLDVANLKDIPGQIEERLGASLARLKRSSVDLLQLHNRIGATAGGRVMTVEQILVRNTVIAAGAKLSKGDLENFIGESLTGFNSNQYIHDKFMLVDPLGDDPIVATGSANFSLSSQTNNDENMLIVRGDTRVADIYFGEFMRIFDHLYSRYIVGKMKKLGTQNPDAGFLKETAAEWVPQHFAKGRKALRRRYFMGA